MLSGISVICFGASYALALFLEVSRLLTQSTWRSVATIGVMAAGVVAHAIFLAVQFQQRSAEGLPWITWYTGCLLLACILSLTFLAILVSRSRSSSGFLLLPTSLSMIVLAHLFPSTPRTLERWNLLHGLSLAFGMALIVVGGIAGIMYLVQSNRLKQKKPPIERLWLPSLERLQKTNERCLFASVALIGLGLVSGILLNLARNSSPDVAIPWSDPTVLASLVWLAWLLGIAIFHATYPPARFGRKVAYMTIGSFVFFGIVLAIIWSMPSNHGSGSQPLRIETAMIELNVDELPSLIATRTLSHFRQTSCGCCS